MFLKDLVKGKRVCIVASAGYISELDQMRLIDEYDVVIRVNRLFYSTNNELEKHIGKKTSVIYQIGYPLSETSVDFDIKQQDIKDQGIIIHFPPHYRHSIIGDNNNLKNYILQNGHDKISQSSPEAIDYMIKINKQTNEEGDWQLNTGAVCIIEVLQYKPKELYLTGFTFFKGDKPYVDGYRDTLYLGKHKPDRDLRLVKECIEESTETFVKMDHVMKNILYKS